MMLFGRFLNFRIVREARLCEETGCRCLFMMRRRPPFPPFGLIFGFSGLGKPDEKAKRLQFSWFPYSQAK